MPKNQGCWANDLDNCRGPLTGEHLLSASVFRPTRREGAEPNRAARLGEEITVTTTDANGERTSRDLTVRRYTQHILCERHNNDTANLDEAGGALVRAIGNVFATHESRRHYRSLRWNRRTYEVDAALVERWLMKTAINHAFDRGLPIGRADARAGWPTRELVEMVYGIRDVPASDGPGMFHLLVPGTFEDRRDKFDLALYEQRGCVAGAMFGFRTFLFGVHLHEEPLHPHAVRSVHRRLNDALIARPLEKWWIDETNVELAFRR